MSERRTATIQDFIMPEFKGKNPDDYEIREDGKPVRKDRWEMAVRRIGSMTGVIGRGDFEIDDVVESVSELLRQVEPVTCDSE